MNWKMAAWPRTVIFGNGALDQLGRELARLGAARAILITDSFLSKTKGMQKIRDAAANHGVTLTVFDQVEPNPTEATVQQAAEAIKVGNCQAIIALGGGSPTDCAKVANVVATHGGVVAEYRASAGGVEKITPRLLPLIAIPTTAGTGSEVTPAAVVTDVTENVKHVIRSDYMIPNLSILDPELTVSLPPSQTAWTGLDALSHGIEAYVSRFDFPVGNMLGLEAIELIAEYLPLAVEDGSNIVAREKMLLAAYVAGMAMAQNRLGIAHAIAHQLTTEFGLAHGLANAVVLPEAMEFNLEVAAEKLARIARALGEDVSGLSSVEAARASIKATEALIRKVGVPDRLDDIKLNEGSFDRIATNALADAAAPWNPRPASREDVMEICRRAIG